MIRDALLYGVLIFMIAVSLVVIFLVFSSFNDAVQSADQFSASNKAQLQTQVTAFPNVWDYTFLTVFFGVIIALCILAWVLDTQPALFFVLVIVIGVFGGIAGYLANAFEELILDPFLSASAANFPIMSHVITNYLFYVIGMMFLMLVVFFAKPAIQQQYGGGY